MNLCDTILTKLSSNSVDDINKPKCEKLSISAFEIFVTSLKVMPINILYEISNAFSTQYGLDGFNKP